MHVLTLTNLFPNSMQPVHAVFIRNRMLNFARRTGNPWTIVAPVPYFPKLPFRVSAHYDALARVPAREDLEGFAVHHPRYLVTPKFGMRWYGDWMAKGVRDTVLSIHRERPIDLIDGHYVFPDGTAALALGHELGIPVVLSARGTDLNHYPDFPAIRPLIRDNLKRCNHLICVCSELKDNAVALGMPSEKITVIGNGVDAQVFRPDDQTAARVKLGLPADKKIFLSVGQLIERKGFHFLIAALAKLEDKLSLLILVGKGPEQVALKALAERVGVGERVLFPGAQANRELPVWYQAADVFAIASSREGWPNVVCEAQATGLPVVATRVAGIPEIINENRLGILVEQRTAEAFAPAMQQALSTPWNRGEIAARGMARTWDSVSDQLLPLFQSVIANRKAKR